MPITPLLQLLQKDCLADQPMLLPLTSAVYVSGKLASHDSILLDIGTGYYAEVTILLLF